ncbi:hypothetical protein HAZT_HAZT005206 [Hyalella azteca]|uniref:G-protein coupled receptors family 1 profile domain-containing protein n=1 Tax=Hyalella azteca TaxID=294128 RepID=A0A6A0GRC2_HYAAZ|nr:hypothetical protein HAZT_HAZT005206 [Hyalella azteca]
MSRNVSLEYSHNGCELLNLMEGSDLKVPLYGYAMPVLLITTTTANTLIVAVLSQRNMKTPSNTILMAISLADLFTLVVPSPVFFYMYTLGHYQKTLLTNSVACYAWTYLILFLNRLGSKRLAREDSSRYSTVNGHRTSETVL